MLVRARGMVSYSPSETEKVVETGVAHGVTSRFILEALSRNGDSHLWSIDLPLFERLTCPRQIRPVCTGIFHLWFPDGTRRIP
jgi:hypothetical protein